MKKRTNILTFGIVIPNLNQTHLIRTALESIRHQTPPTQVAIMDGGSKDNIQEIFEEYKNQVAYFTSKKDNGQSAAIKEGWKRIGGDIIAWLNADDYLFPQALDKISECFEKNSDIDVVYGDAVHVTENGSFLGYFPAIKPFERTSIGKDNYICQPACFMRRSAYDNICGIDASLKYTMDWDLWCKLSASGAKFKYLRVPLAAVRYYEGIKTLTRSFDRYREIMRIEMKYGNRRVPLSVLGADYYGIMIKKKKTTTQNFYTIVFNCLRSLKKALYYHRCENESICRLYGLTPWNNNAKDACIIHLPWYRKVQDWDHIWLELEPAEDLYEIRINGNKLGIEITGNARQSIPLPITSAPHLKVEVKSRKGRPWRITRFKCA
jgi:glycosyltransferase involved in cell wall biosynthesis